MTVWNDLNFKVSELPLSIVMCRMNGRNLTVTFAEPRAPRESMETSAANSTQGAGQIKSVFVGQLPETATEEKLKELFTSFGAIERVVIPAAREDRPRREFGFVHFEEQASAQQVVESTETFTLDGKDLSVRHDTLPSTLTPFQSRAIPMLGDYFSMGGEDDC